MRLSTNVFLILVAGFLLHLAPKPTSGQDVEEVTVDLDMPFPDNPERVSGLLQRIEENAVDIRDGAVRVDSFIRSPGQVLWGTYRWRLNRIWERFEELEAALDRLDLRADMLLDGQQEALDYVRPASRELSMQIPEAIEYLDTVQGEVDSEYAARVAAIRENADRILGAVRLAESLSEVRKHLEALDTPD